MLLAAAIAIGFLLGAAAVWLWARAELTRREAEITRRDDALRHERAAAADKLALVERTQGQWEEHVKALTGDALSKSQSSLLEIAEAKLKPIKETLDRFDRQAQELEQRRQRAVTAVGEQLRVVAEGQERLRTETGNLVTALRSPHVRGRWGEVQLRRVVEAAGMVANCDFVEQTSGRDDDGRLLRPDMIVKLAGGRNIVVDSKVPIEAYLAAIEAEDVDQRRAHLARHAAQVRDHITKLGQKRYWQQFEPSPEFVVMFVDEGLYRAAHDQDPTLFDAGVGVGVVVASPATLLGLLWTVAHGWQQETIADSARSMSKLGRELYERLGVFAKHFSKVGRSLDTAVTAYNEAVGSFETRVLVSARKFPEHGVASEELAEVTVVERQSRPFFAPELETGDELVELPLKFDAA